METFHWHCRQFVKRSRLTCLESFMATWLSLMSSAHSWSFPIRNFVTSDKRLWTTNRITNIWNSDFFQEATLVFCFSDDVILTVSVLHIPQQTMGYLCLRNESTCETRVESMCYCAILLSRQKSYPRKLISSAKRRYFQKTSSGVANFLRD